MDKIILIPIAQGTEEIEAVVAIDLFRRAGFNTKLAGESSLVTCSRGLKIIPDLMIEDISENEYFDIIYLPGGLNGTKNLSENEYLGRIIKKGMIRGTIIAAICAAPTILATLGLLKPDTKITSHPSVKSQLAHFDYRTDAVVEYDNIITSRGAGTTFDLVFRLIELKAGNEIAEKIIKDIVY